MTKPPLRGIPVPVEESSIKQFCFFVQGQIATGMVFNNKLYVLHQGFNRKNLGQLLQLVSTFMYEGSDVVITISQDRKFYKMWLDLRHLTKKNSVDTPFLAVSNPSFSHSPEWALKWETTSYENQCLLLQSLHLDVVKNFQLVEIAVA